MKFVSCLILFHLDNALLQAFHFFMQPVELLPNFIIDRSQVDLLIEQTVLRSFRRNNFFIDLTGDVSTNRNVFELQTLTKVDAMHDLIDP